MARWFQLITGHNYLSYHRNKLDILINPKCRLCEEQNETFVHLIAECPKLQTERRQRFTHEITDDHTWSVKKIIDFSRLPAVNNLLSTDEYLYKDIIEIEHNLSSDSSS